MHAVAPADTVGAATRKTEAPVAMEQHQTKLEAQNVETSSDRETLLTVTTPRPDRASREPEMPRTPRLEDFGLRDIAEKYGRTMDNENETEDAGEDEHAVEDTEVISDHPEPPSTMSARQTLTARRQKLAKVQFDKQAAPADSPADTDLQAVRLEAIGFTPRQSPRLAAKRQQSPMEKVFARASSPSPLKVLNHTDSHGLTNLKSGLSAATQPRTSQQ